MNPDPLRVRLGERSYDVVVTTGALDGVGPFARAGTKGVSALIVTDTNAAPHAEAVRRSLEQAGFRTVLAARPPGEAQKSLDIARELYDALLNMRADRKTLVAAVGGGVVGDLAGFVASTYARGLPLLMVPTTLLAMVDSAIGGKVAVNHPRAKNLIGTFHQPIGVWIDTATLDTLPPREYCSGLAEVVKCGVVLDADLFTYVEEAAAAILKRDPEAVRRIVVRCCELKAGIVEQDERDETGLRAMLNYGHTFAHAFETAGGYEGWLHGEAVAAGMVCASRLAERHRLLGAQVTERQIRLLREFGLPTAPARWPIDQLIETMRRDKKSAGGKMRLILPRGLGQVALYDNVQEGDVRQVLEEAMV
jgi:3-dehydroquinate synthase